MLVTNSLVTDLWIAVVTVFIAAYFYIKYKYSYWTRKGIPQLTPTFPFGNFLKGLPRGIALGAHSLNFYNEFKKSGNKLGGVYLGLDPCLVLTDTTYAKNILTKDFSHFVNRGIFISKKNPITVNILTQETDEWRKSRTKMTNIFTSSKMKFFFSTIKKCCDELKGNLITLSNDDKDVDIYEVMACYFTDVIGSVVYGVEANSFKHPDAIFRKLGRDLFETHTLPFRIVLFLTICYPKLAVFLGIGSIQNDIEKFFNEFVPEALEHRTKNNILRADFLQLLIEMRKSGEDLTMEEMVSQSFTFFSAGFETSSRVSSLLLYELGMNKDIQQKLRDEINEVLKKHNGEATYESFKEMTYFDQAFYETMRKYPLLTTLSRICVKDYQFPDSNIVIEEGTKILLPVLGYHRDPNTFPDPLKFNPDRFKDKTVKYEGYFPFGDGPRNCIGARLGHLQVKMGIIEIIKNYEVSVSPSTTSPLEFDQRTFVTKMKQKVFVTIKKIEN